MSGTFDFFWAPDEGVDVEDIRSLVPYVIERAPGSDGAEVRRALASAVHSFLKDTGVWTKDVPCRTEEDCVKVAAGGCARVTAVTKIVRDSDDVTVYDTAMPFGSGERRGYDDNAGVFTLDIPDTDGETYTATVTLATRMGSELCPPWILARWGEAIAARAAHALLSKGQMVPTSYYLEYKNAVREIIARRAMGGSGMSAGPANAATAGVERY